MKFIGIIPARYGSTRFPGKPLAMIHGKSMIQRVYEQASQCPELQQVVVATDDERIVKHVSAFAKVLMTSSIHASGTDRCMEAVDLLRRQADLDPHTVIVNIQGDEPFIQPQQISLLAKAFDIPGTRIATLVKPVEDSSELMNENVVKAVISIHNQALYFSRQPIPFFRGLPQQEWIRREKYYKHIGLYAYTLEALAQITALPASSYEQAESLEQLRWLQNGIQIRTMITHYQAQAVDTPGDLEKINKRLS